MATDNRGSELEDPLADYSGLSLFPRSLMSSLPNPPKLADLHDAHTFLRSMPITSPSRFQEEAKFIVDSNSELLNSTNEVQVAAKCQENNRERRPGLGRKRARFSLKPNSSQPTVNLEPTLDISKLNDPEEFFAAFDRVENAKMELQRQTGSVLTEIDENKLFEAAPRPRREGISGRKVKAKHSYSFSLPSQDTIEEEDSSPHDQSPQKETINANHESETIELEGSINKTGDKENELLDELLNGSYEDLDGDKAVNILRERLQIKSFDLEKLSLPDMGDIRKMDLKTSVANPQKPRKSLSDIYSSLKGVTINNTPLKRTSAEILESPSPVASLSLLKKRVFQSNPLLAPDIDLSPQSDASPVKNGSQQPDCAETEKVDLNASVTEENNPSGSHPGMEDYIKDCVDHGIVSEDNNEDQVVVNEENTEDTFMDHEVVNEDNAENADVDQSIPAVVEDHAMDGCSNTVNNVPENHDQEIQDSTRVPLQEQRKNVPRPSKVRKSKIQSRRDSLAASGTILENGARRSTRIRSRPLEYWKGERFLYGRVHQSLPTVIGIKYESPAKQDAKPTFKVKSYVAEEYKELVDFAALH